MRVHGPAHHITRRLIGLLCWHINCHKGTFFQFLSLVTRQDYFFALDKVLFNLSIFDMLTHDLKRHLFARMRLEVNYASIVRHLMHSHRSVVFRLKDVALAQGVSDVLRALRHFQRLTRVSLTHSHRVTVDWVLHRVVELHTGRVLQHKRLQSTMVLWAVVAHTSSSSKGTCCIVTIAESRCINWLLWFVKGAIDQVKATTTCLWYRWLQEAIHLTGLVCAYIDWAAEVTRRPWWANKTISTAILAIK